MQGIYLRNITLSATLFQSIPSTLVSRSSCWVILRQREINNKRVGRVTVLTRPGFYTLVSDDFRLELQV